MRPQCLVTLSVGIFVWVFFLLLLFLCLFSVCLFLVTVSTQVLLGLFHAFKKNLENLPVLSICRIQSAIISLKLFLTFIQLVFFKSTHEKDETHLRARKITFQNENDFLFLISPIFHKWHTTTS